MQRIVSDYLGEIYNIVSDYLGEIYKDIRPYNNVINTVIKTIVYVMYIYI